MSDKKHIDRIFQEGFKDFEVTPPAEVWEGIQAALKKEEKEDRKIIPIWWRVGGVAALLALLFTVGTVWWPGDDSSNSFTQEEVIPADSESDAEQNTSDDSQKANQLVDNSSEDAVAGQLEETPSTTDSNTDAESKFIENKSVEGVASTNTQNKTTDKNNPIDKSAIDKTIDAVTTEAVATNKGTENQNTENRSSDVVKDSQLVDDKTATDLIESQTGIAANTDSSNKTGTDAQTDQTNPVENTEEGKISIFDAIKDQEEADAVATVEQQSQIDNRWSVAPQVAPVFYGSFGDGSTVGAEFADNPTSADANLSYGVQVQYQVTDRFAVRSGVNRVNLSVNTNEIEFAVAPAGIDAGASKFVTGNVAYSVGDKGTLAGRFAQAAPTEGLDLPPIDAFEGLLNQRFEYWEVPLELSYAVVNDRFKVNVFGGFSTLLLQDNSITAISGQRETNLGSVNNLNDLSFTTNVGLGLQYDISKRFAINVEPVFKYQLNPYADSSIGSQPYYMGVYSGLRFRF